MTENIRRHSERQRRICYCGEGNGKKIKAISCKLLAVSWQLSAKMLNDGRRSGVTRSNDEGLLP